MKQWMMRRNPAALDRIASRYGISEIMAEVLVKRGLHTWDAMDAYLYPSWEKLYAPKRMKDLPEAVQLLREKIAAGSTICVIGDYDVDGIMASAILITGLRELGAQVIWRLPHRVRDGYGMRGYMAEEAFAKGADTIITCDNGISAVKAIGRAKELGMTVILTDHHEVPRDEQGAQLLPPADVIVDPKRDDCSYPWDSLCGAGVAWKLIQKLCQDAGQKMNPDLIAFAGIATVCDVMTLQGENRILVKLGLERLQQLDNLGLRSLIQALDFNREIRSSDLGFRIGPCLNAAGRLEDAAQGLRLLLTEDGTEATALAANLVALNEERKEITSDAVEQALAQMEEQKLSEDPVLVLLVPDCPESVAGIVAGRIRERFYKPTMILSRSQDKCKGSGRSIPGYHMQREISRCQELLLEYGGHAMAAGFSLEEDKVEAFREQLIQNCTLQPEDFVEKITFDREVPLGEVDRTLVQELSLLEPVGEGNQDALFARRRVRLLNVRIFGKENQIGRFQVEDEGRRFSIVDFDIYQHIQPAVEARYGTGCMERLLAGNCPDCYVDLLYVPAINARYGDVEYRVKDAR